MPQLWMPGDGGEADKRHAPATLRNRDAIAAVLADWLPPAGSVIEVASGSGEHVIHFAAAFPHLHWQPSDPDPAGLVSIAAWRAEAGLSNVAPPLALDGPFGLCPHGGTDAREGVGGRKEPRFGRLLGHEGLSACAGGCVFDARPG